MTESADVRHHAQPVGPRAHARRLERRHRRPRSPPGWSAAALGYRRRRLDPHPGRAAAGCSGSSRSAAACRSPRDERTWHGLTVFGPLTRTVRRRGAVPRRRAPTAAAGVRRGRRAGARARCGSPCSLEGPAGRRRAPGRRAARRASSASVELLRALGHDGRGARPDYGNLAQRGSRATCAGSATTPGGAAPATGWRAATRGYRAARRGDPGRAAAPRARARARPTATRLNALFDDFDVLLTPMFTRRPLPIGEWEGRGALWTLNGSARWAPYSAPWNHTGQPAASVPAGFTADGFPLAVQLVGAPDDEATLLSLAAQLEAALDWPSLRPPAA